MRTKIEIKVMQEFIPTKHRLEGPFQFVLMEIRALPSGRPKRYPASERFDLEGEALEQIPPAGIKNCFIAQIDKDGEYSMLWHWADHRWIQVEKREFHL